MLLSGTPAVPGAVIGGYRVVKESLLTFPPGSHTVK
jgi:hypothetical protein